jgi:hypothetical protein
MEHTKRGRKRYFTNFPLEIYFRNLKKRETSVAHIRKGATNNLGSKGVTGPILTRRWKAHISSVISFHCSDA